MKTRTVPSGLTLIAAIVACCFCSLPSLAQQRPPAAPEAVKTAQGATLYLVIWQNINGWNQAKTDFLMLDVRTTEEHASHNFPHDAHVVPFRFHSETGAWTDNREFMKSVKALATPDRKVVIWMTYNDRSRAAGEMLADAGYTDVNVMRSYPAMDDSDHPVVTAETVRRWLDQKVPFRIIDVQSTEEHDDYGYPAGSVCVPLSMPKADNSGWERNPQFLEQIAALAGKDEKIVIICTVGARAGSATKLLKEAGYSDVQSYRYGIRGRMTGAEYEIRAIGWADSGLPFVRGPKFEEENRAR